MSEHADDLTDQGFSNLAAHQRGECDDLCEYCNTHSCEQEDCSNTDAIACRLDEHWPDGEVDHWFCPDHAAQAGFCGVCGSFNAGLDRFDIGPGQGLCDTCWSQIRTDADYLEADEDQDEEEYD